MTSTSPLSPVSGAAVTVVVLAAGQGTRMKSRQPKVLQRLAGQPLLQRVLCSAAAFGARRALVITGHAAEAVEAAASGWLDAINSVANNADTTGAKSQFCLEFVRQQPQCGTGHAVQQALPLLAADEQVLVLSGDVPLIQPDTLRALCDCSAGEALALLTIRLPDATGYGRIVRQGEAVQAIVEQRDATPAQCAIDEVYSGIMALPAAWLKRWLPLLRPHNAQGELYLTDIVALAVADGAPVRAQRTDDAWQVAGVNSPAQLAALERRWQHRQAEALLEQGVRLADPARFDLRGTLVCGQDVDIDINCVFEGRVRLGDGVRIGAHCVIANAEIADAAQIAPFTHIDGGAQGVTVGAGAQVGPFARLRPGARLGPQVHIGNFVEVKNSTLAAGAKANHLAYLGDASVGERVNFGAGSITANYDGANKHRTVIEADVHVGSNCVLVAPLTLGAGSTVGGGSTLTRNLPAGALGLERAKAVTLANWRRPPKKTAP